MAAVHSSLLDRITIDPDVRFGKPCIRGHRITVQDILQWLSTGVSQQQILADYPQLEPDDFHTSAGLPTWHAEARSTREFVAVANF